MNWEKLQQEIRQVRSEKGITQQELSEMTGITRANIARLETSEKNPTVGTVSKVCEALGVSVEPVRTHWIIGTSFIGAENGILTMWNEKNGQKTLSFEYQGILCEVDAPAIGNRKENMAFYNLAAEIAVDKFIHDKETEIMLEGII